ncbi:lysine-specific demethylase 5D-like isoform X2 [Petromyzon marinus]|uniref:lysine-specific demethylase 5D-like isoform X2 n=1 Tax=Petromyzon marinus TaxID=7757 RepID=UPI003F712BCD
MGSGGGEEFVPPPECPVFQPTWEEFGDPLAYIAKIRPIGEKTGICKIRPPPEWQPPFAVDVDNFRFTPRIQRLNELEAQTRVKLNFLDQIAKFWELQGSTLKIPILERKLLDLYMLSKVVAEEGGFEIVCKDRKWSRVAAKMGYMTGKAVGSLLRVHYERILYPHNLFQSGVSLSTIAQSLNQKTPIAQAVAEFNYNECIAKPEYEPDEKDQEYKPHSIPLRQSLQHGKMNCAGRRANRMKTEPDPIDADVSSNSELRKLQIFGAGPKMAGLGLLTGKDRNGKESEGGERGLDDVKALPSMDIQCPEPEPEPQTAIIPEKVPSMKDSKMELKPVQLKEADIIANVDLYECLVCGRGDDEAKLLLCDGCDDSYHTFCLIPPLQDVPKGDWRCPKCVAQECSKPQEAFGFEQAKRVYTLRSFGEMADVFKSDYFNMPVHMVPTELVEKEFWRLVSCIEEDVSVEYGADVQAKEYGSGFPVKNGKKKLSKEEEEYTSSGWNLNNMPVLPQSLLGHIDGDISGMKVPWLYVGMCFSSFCWHIEDHWSYSINYLHWGEPKTWYGVPAYAAESLENVMRTLAPELFLAQPDLLHQLVTIMNPNILMAHDVPVVRTNQCPGEFVVTFPRAYHSGFNQGYNFAEAVNFCTADWLPMGRRCVEHYRLMRRYCVFSHEELLCRMACETEGLALPMASAIGRELEIAIDEERKLRREAWEMGVSKSEPFEFELLADDERQCHFCKTTCYLSAIACPCCPGRLVCLYHIRDLCRCPTQHKILRYRYTLDELPPMLHKLKSRAEIFDAWAEKVRRALEEENGKKSDLSALKALLEESEMHDFPESSLRQNLMLLVLEADQCASMAQDLMNSRNCVRDKSGATEEQVTLSLEEFKAFVNRLEKLPCTVNYMNEIKELLERVEGFRDAVQLLLVAEDKPDLVRMQELLKEAEHLAPVHLPEKEQLEQRVQRERWLEEVHTALASSLSSQDQGLSEKEAMGGGVSCLNIEVLRRLIDSAMPLGAEPVMDQAVAELQEILTVAESWEDRARACLQARPRMVRSTLESIVAEAHGVPVHLPTVQALKVSLQQADDWTADLEKIQAGDHYPYCSVLERMVSQGRCIPVQLDALSQLEGWLEAASIWQRRAARTFLRRNSCCTLLEVLNPKTCAGDAEKGNECGDNKRTPSQGTDPSFVDTYRSAEREEVEAMRRMREASRASGPPPEGGTTTPCGACGHGDAGLVRQCHQCRAPCHHGCVAPTHRRAGARALCTRCVRSKRPQMATVLNLLVGLQGLPVRLPEGEALQCLAERAMGWQDRVHQALSQGEVVRALEKLKSQPSSHKVAHNTKSRTTIGQKENPNNGSCGTLANVSSEHGGNDDPTYDLQPLTSTSCTELAQSSVCSSQSSRSQQQFHSLLLPPTILAQLEDLLMQGDLIEVSLQETRLLWRLLSSPSSSADQGREHENEALNTEGEYRDDKTCKRKPESEEVCKEERNAADRPADGRKRTKVEKDEGADSGAEFSAASSEHEAQSPSSREGEERPGGGVRFREIGDKLERARGGAAGAVVVGLENVAESKGRPQDEV